MDESHFPARQIGDASRIRTRGADSDLHVRRVTDPVDLARFSRERVRAYQADGIAIEDSPYAMIRAKGTTLAMMRGVELVGGICVWRWSHGNPAFRHPAHSTLARLEALSDVVEIGGLFVSRAYRAQGYSQILLNAAAQEVIRMRPRVLVALSVESQVSRYIRRFGFRVAGPPQPHPLSPTLRVAALTQSFSSFIEQMQTR